MDKLNITEITLKKYKYELHNRITEEYLNDMNIDIVLDRMAKEIKFRFRKEILGRKMDKIEFPANWKEAVKEAFYNWFNKKYKAININNMLKIKIRTKLAYIWASLNDKYPVKHNVYEVREYYPKISIPEHEHYVRFERVEEDLNRWEVE